MIRIICRIVMGLGGVYLVFMSQLLLTGDIHNATLREDMLLRWVGGPIMLLAGVMIVACAILLGNDQ